MKNDDPNLAASSEQRIVLHSDDVSRFLNSNEQSKRSQDCNQSQCFAYIAASPIFSSFTLYGKKVICREAGMCCARGETLFEDACSGCTTCLGKWL